MSFEDGSSFEIFPGQGIWPLLESAEERERERAIPKESKKREAELDVQHDIKYQTNTGPFDQAASSPLALARLSRPRLTARAFVLETLSECGRCTLIDGDCCLYQHPHCQVVS